MTTNIPSLKYSQYIAEFRSLPTVCALSGSRMSLSLSLCKDHVEGISVMHCLVLFKARKKAIVVMSNCLSRAIGLRMLFSVPEYEERGRNRCIDAWERASTVSRTGGDTIANCKPWIPKICPRSHMSSCVCQSPHFPLSVCANVPMVLPRSDSGEAAQASLWGIFQD